MKGAGAQDASTRHFCRLMLCGPLLRTHVSSLERMAFRWGILINLVVDVSLLCIMFVGVLHKKNATYLWRMLYLQSIFWILTAVVTEVPSVVSTDGSFIVSRAI
jgi:hypothetical protein